MIESRIMKLGAWGMRGLGFGVNEGFRVSGLGFQLQQQMYSEEAYYPGAYSTSNTRKVRT